MQRIDEVKNFEGKRVLVCTDWNVPIEDEGHITDTERIDSSLQTIRYIVRNGGRVVVVSHVSKEGGSLRTAYEYFVNLEEFRDIRSEIIFSEDIDNVGDSEVVVIENIRRWSGEEENDENFAKQLASLADMYVNESFSTSHREHATIVGVPKYLPHFAGFQFLREVEALSRAFNPPHPFLLILGGAKFETKLPLVEKFLHIADEIFIGGAMKAHKDLAPRDSKIFFSLDDIDALDAGEETLSMLKGKIQEMKFILWNGPLGKFEAGYDKGTKELAEALALSEAEVIVGGGDTLSAIKSLGIKDKFTHVSSAGGAMLDFLATGTLPGIEALR